MHFDIQRKDGKLILENLSCDCAYNHDLPEMDVYIESGLIEKTAQCLTSAGLTGGVLIVADETTYGVAGERIERLLGADGFDCRLCILAGEVEPTPERADEICAHVSDSTDFLLAVGSGVVTDLTRRASVIRDLPFAVFGTAASMDGYTSITSAMMIDGMKTTLYGKQARLLMFDPAVLATAPPIMQAAGVGDVYAKYNVLVDWKLGCAVSGETFCPLCAALVERALARCSENIGEIAQRTEKGMEALIEALILAGLTVLIVRYTRPVASIEHNLSHYFEMMALAYGGEAPSHGVGVGIGLIYALIMHDMLRAADLGKLDREKIKASRVSEDEKRRFLISSYPPGVGEEIIANNPHWFLSWEEQQARIEKLALYHAQYQKDAQILPAYTDVIRIFEQLNAPTSAAKAGIGRERLAQALRCTHLYRPRYSIGAALEELGMLEAAAQKILAMEDDL